MNKRIKSTAALFVFSPATALASVGGTETATTGGGGGTGFDGFSTALSGLLQGSVGKAVFAVLLFLAVMGIIFPMMRKFIFIAVIFAAVSGQFSAIMDWLTKLFGNK